jgi:holo-[acyl-carrier protein] synthase
MIHGIGTDIVEIARIEDTLRRHGERFAARILGPRELERYHQRMARHTRRGLAFLATRFAAKEAVSKALKLGMRTPMTWRAVEIVNAPSGEPVALAHGALAQWLEARALALHVSLSDERGVAVAYAIAEHTAAHR